MAIMKATPELERAQKSSTSHHHHHHHQSPKKQNLKSSPFFLYSPKIFVYFLIICVVLFILFNIQTLQLPPSSSFPTNSPSWPFIQQWQRLTIWNTTTTTDLTTISNKLRLSVTFLPLKDLRYSHIALEGHTWFMSSMYDTLHEGEVQYQQFPSESSHGRLLCIKGHDNHDGSWNYYALAWSETLPLNATLMKGLTFVSYNHYDYGNIWHGLSAVMPFVAWHKKNGCLELPSRWVLYHWGELRLNMGLWLETLMGATFDEEPYIEGFDGIDEETPVCFEKAVVMRHNEGGMSRENRMEVYDLMRCKARLYCNITSSATSNDHYKNNTIVMTLFMRTGPRSFKNETAVIGIFKTECAKVDGCLLKVVYSNNLTFCGQVKVMSMTDILISPHGAQLTNMFLMDRNSSVMEFFPKGWLKVAGVGQYVYHWIASWSGMKHQGAWRDPDGEHCPYAEDDRRCMSIYKNGLIGYNDTYFAEWAKNVLNEVKARKKEDHSVFINGGCTCN